MCDGSAHGMHQRVKPVATICQNPTRVRLCCRARCDDGTCSCAGLAAGLHVLPLCINGNTVRCKSLAGGIHEISTKLRLIHVKTDAQDNEPHGARPPKSIFATFYSEKLFSRELKSVVRSF